MSNSQRPASPSPSIDSSSIVQHNTNTGGSNIRRDSLSGSATNSNMTAGKQPSHNPELKRLQDYQAQQLQQAVDDVSARLKASHLGTNDSQQLSSAALHRTPSTSTNTQSTQHLHTAETYEPSITRSQNSNGLSVPEATTSAQPSASPDNTTTTTTDSNHLPTPAPTALRDKSPTPIMTTPRRQRVNTSETMQEYATPHQHESALPLSRASTYTHHKPADDDERKDTLPTASTQAQLQPTRRTEHESPLLSVYDAPSPSPSRSLDSSRRRPKPLNSQLISSSSANNSPHHLVLPPGESPASNTASRLSPAQRSISGASTSIASSASRPATFIARDEDSIDGKPSGGKDGVTVYKCPRNNFASLNEATVALYNVDEFLEQMKHMPLSSQYDIDYISGKKRESGAEWLLYWKSLDSHKSPFQCCLLLNQHTQIARDYSEAAAIADSKLSKRRKSIDKMPATDRSSSNDRVLCVYTPGQRCFDCVFQSRHECNVFSQKLAVLLGLA